MNDAKHALEERAKRLFDESVEQLDAATLSRLNQARQKALEASPRRMPSIVRWAPVGGLATAAAVAMLLIQSPSTVDLPTDAGAVEFEILLSNLELCQC